eukprot:c1086_g1_i1.p1 GENE.c1086_g1_i1~~c1086_g1_i1.p1  ORF type:complete len:189 (-),score=40.64 c1086_g1_i1:191-757(-)
MSPQTLLSFLLLVNLGGGIATMAEAISGMVQGLDAKNTLIHIYVLGLGSVFTLVQVTNIPPIIKQFGFMKSWYGRSLFLILMGVIGIQEVKRLTVIFGLIAVGFGSAEFIVITSLHLLNAVPPGDLDVIGINNLSGSDDVLKSARHHDRHRARGASHHSSSRSQRTTSKQSSSVRNGVDEFANKQLIV